MKSNFEAKRSFEQISHFSCNFCKKWWSIGDAPRERTEWTCPWCGNINNYTNSATPLSKD